MNKPFKTYNGGKEADGTYQKIINEIPPHDLYIEGFLGNGAIFRHKTASRWSIGIDLDMQVIKQWIRSGVTSLSVNNGLILEQVDTILFLETFTVLANILKNIGIRVFIYLDPPYPKDCRKNPRDLYKHEMTEEQHGRLLRVVNNLKNDCLIMVSSYPNKLYDSHLSEKSFRTTTFQSQTRNGPATEKLWMNYPEPTELHDYRYLGDDYRERERIKGIITRNTAKIKRMPAVERQALFENLKNEKLI